MEYEHTKKDLSEIESAVSYFANNSLRMKYKKIRDMKMPIGSGVTEAACKVIVKERMCKSGMRWSDRGARIALKLRSMNQTEGCWDFFWDKINRHGFDMVA